MLILIFWLIIKALSNFVLLLIQIKEISCALQCILAKNSSLTIIGISLSSAMDNFL